MSTKPTKGNAFAAGQYIVNERTNIVMFAKPVKGNMF